MVLVYRYFRTGHFYTRKSHNESCGFFYVMVFKMLRLLVLIVKLLRMKIDFKLIAIALLLVAAGCKDKPKNELVMEDTKVVAAYPISEKWIANRVEKAKTRLNASEAGKVIWNAMEAQGGLATWYANGYLTFRFDYQPEDGSTRRNSYQTIDTWNNKARHASFEDSTAIFGWDGKEAWVKAKDTTAFEYDTRFWALTPLYLAGHPFVLDGEGVNLELLDQKEYKGNLQDVVKVTFGANVGDAPEDYYVLYFDSIILVLLHANVVSLRFGCC